MTGTITAAREYRPASALTDAIRRHPLLVVWLLVAVVVRIAFWVVTDRTWEDALITIANARNAAEGLGLTNHPGEGLVHAYTSAVSVLIPLVGELVHPGWGLTALRVVSVIAAVATIAYAYAITRRLGLGAWATSFVLGYLALNQNHILYGMSGMETQVAVAAVLVGIYQVLSGHYARSGLVAGFAILARPDLVLLAIPVLIWAGLAGRRSLARAGLGTLAVVAPWVAFTTLYYGSPIPHSIPAKALVWSPLGALGGSTVEIVQFMGERAVTGLATAVRAFTPFYEDSFVLSAPFPMWMLLGVGATMLVLAVIGAWTTRRIEGWWPALGFVGMFAVYRVLLLPHAYFDWYLPPFTAACALLVGAGLQRARVRTPLLAHGLAVLLVIGTAAHLPFSFPLELRIQREIEDGIRRPVGLYLHDVVAPGQAFVAEAAGYFGYYSRATIWDQPGLTSPTAYAATRSLPPEDRRVEGLLNALRADWAVLRPAEWERLERDFPEAALCYSPTRSFGHPDRDRIAWDGLEKVSFDWSYTVYRRDGCGTASE